MVQLTPKAYAADIAIPAAVLTEAAVGAHEQIDHFASITAQNRGAIHQYKDTESKTLCSFIQEKPS